MSQKVTEILYNIVLSSGKAKEIASTLSLNYATFMREINIYDPQAKLSLKTFVHVVEFLQEPALIYAIADMFELDITFPGFPINRVDIFYPKLNNNEMFDCLKR